MLPLSLGRLKGDAIECGYHGMIFDGAGKCIRIPGQNVIPRNAVVRAYPTGERLGSGLDLDGGSDVGGSEQDF